MKTGDSTIDFIECGISFAIGFLSGFFANLGYDWLKSLFKHKKGSHYSIDEEDGRLDVSISVKADGKNVSRAMQVMSSIVDDNPQTTG